MIDTVTVLYDVTSLEIGQLTGLSPLVVDQDAHQNNDDEQIDVLGCYLREIARYSLLSDTQERLLLARVAQGDHEARTRLIEANLRLVVTIATCYQGHVQDHRHLDLLDLIQCGNLGLIGAVDHYDYSYETLFTLCAIHAIVAAIQQALAHADGSGHRRAFFEQQQAS